MGKIFIGSSDISSVKVGLTNVSKVMIGTTQVYPGNYLLTDLVSCYEFDETTLSDTAIDSHGTNNIFFGGASTPYPPVVGETGLINKCYYFNLDYIRSSSNILDLDATNAFTISGWFKNIDSNSPGTAGFCFNPSTSSYKIIAPYLSGSLTTDSISTYIRQSNGVTTAGASYSNGSVFTNDNVWHFYVGIFDRYESSGIRLKTYWDNVLIGSATAYSQSLITGSGSWSFGFWGATNRLNAYYDQVGIWKRALTEEEIDILYNNGNGLAYSSWG